MSPGERRSDLPFAGSGSIGTYFFFLFSSPLAGGKMAASVWPGRNPAPLCLEQHLAPGDASDQHLKNFPGRIDFSSGKRRNKVFSRPLCTGKYYFGRHCFLGLFGGISGRICVQDEEVHDCDPCFISRPGVG